MMVYSVVFDHAVSPDFVEPFLSRFAETLDKAWVEVFQAVFDPVDQLLGCFGTPALRVHHVCVVGAGQVGPKHIIRVISSNVRN